ncbi:MAG: hypothetical protein HKN17_11430, partial [Rhodothermales bacterium]|nr:hypothetical protein [Rhodothermales bacterium]
MSDRDGRMALYRMSLDGPADSARVELLDLTSGEEYAPIWNRNGTELMFTSDESGTQNVWMWDAVADTVFRLRPDTMKQSVGDFSPDGRSVTIVFQSGDFTTNEIFLMDREGGDLEQLTDNELYDVTPRFSPDGSRIAFCRQHIETTDDGEQRNGDIFVMDLASREVQRVTTGPAFDCLPAWSPDGSRITYHGCGPDGCFIHVVEVVSGVT